MRSSCDVAIEGSDFIVTIKADKKCRVVLPGTKPGDVFNVELSSGKIILTKLVSTAPKLFRARRVKGIVMGARDVEINSDVIVDAIRADREQVGIR